MSFNRCNYTCAMIQFNRQNCVHDSVLSWHFKQKIAFFLLLKQTNQFIFFLCVKYNKVLFIKAQEKKKVSHQKSTLYLWWFKPMFTTPSGVQTFCWTWKNPSCNMILFSYQQWKCQKKKKKKHKNFYALLYLHLFSAIFHFKWEDVFLMW